MDCSYVSSGGEFNDYDYIQVVFSMLTSVEDINEFDYFQLFWSFWLVSMIAMTWISFNWCCLVWLAPTIATIGTMIRLTLSVLISVDEFNAFVHYQSIPIIVDDVNDVE